MRSPLLKRALDLVGAGTATVIFAPAMLATAAAIRLTMGAPVLFRQRRPGLHAEPFEIYKFRTMADRRDAEGRLLPDAERMTTVGRVIRSLSLDELPQLLNVLRGEMSLVGPRPLLVEYLPRYSPRQARRHDVKPGMTGWTAVKGRNALTWDEKFELDVWYVDNWSVFVDLKILAMTVAGVLRRGETAAPGHVTMPEFLGTERVDGRT